MFRIEWWDQAEPWERTRTVQWWPEARTSELGRVLIAGRVTAAGVWPAPAEVADQVSPEWAAEVAHAMSCGHRLLVE